MKTAVPQVSHRGTLVEQAGICSTCVPPGAGKTRRGGTPAIPCPVSKIGGCSTWTTKKQHTPASARHSPVVALCGLFPGGVETCPARTAAATSERVARTSRSSFLGACAICTLSQDTAPTGRGMRKQDKAAGPHTRRGPHRTAEPAGKTGVFRGFPAPPVGSAQRVKTC